jgi:hypothetical protein
MYREVAATQRASPSECPATKLILLAEVVIGEGVRLGLAVGASVGKREGVWGGRRGGKWRAVGWRVAPARATEVVKKMEGAVVHRRRAAEGGSVAPVRAGEGRIQGPPCLKAVHDQRHRRRCGRRLRGGQVLVRREEFQNHRCVGRVLREECHGLDVD